MNNQLNVAGGNVALTRNADTTRSRLSLSQHIVTSSAWYNVDDVSVSIIAYTRAANGSVIVNSLAWSVVIGFPHCLSPQYKRELIKVSSACSKKSNWCSRCDWAVFYDMIGVGCLSNMDRWSVVYFFLKSYGECNRLITFASYPLFKQLVCDGGKPRDIPIINNFT